MTKAIENFYQKHKHRYEIDHVIDFLKSKYNHKKSINFSYEEALRKTSEWTDSLNKKNKKLKESGKVKIIHKFSKGFNLVRLLDPTSRKWEGLHMGHCVASDCYNNHDGLYSLRDKNNIPKCTIEIYEERVKQIKGKGNGSVSPKYVDMIIKSLSILNAEIETYDLGNLGYYPLPEILEAYNLFKNIKIKIFDSKKYMYGGNEICLDESVFKKLKRDNIDFNLIDIFSKSGQGIEYVKKYDFSTKPLFLIQRFIERSVYNGHSEIFNHLIKGFNLRTHKMFYAQMLATALHSNHNIIVKSLINKEESLIKMIAFPDDITSIAGRKGRYSILDSLAKDYKIKPSIACLKEIIRTDNVDIFKKYLKLSGLSINVDNGVLLQFAANNRCEHSNIIDGTSFEKNNILNYLLENKIKITEEALSRACEAYHLNGLRIILSKEFKLSNPEEVLFSAIDNSKMIELTMKNTPKGYEFLYGISEELFFDKFNKGKIGAGSKIVNLYLEMINILITDSRFNPYSNLRILENICDLFIKSKSNLYLKKLIEHPGSTEEGLVLIESIIDNRV